MIKRGILIMTIFITAVNNVNAQIPASLKNTNTTAFYRQNLLAKNKTDFFDLSFNNAFPSIIKWQDLISKMLQPKTIPFPKVSKPHKYLDVSKSKFSGNPKFLDTFLGNGVLKGKGAQFYKAQQKYGVDATFLIAIAKLESGTGTSNLAKKNYNFAGMRGRNGWLKFSSVDAGIDAMARNIKKNYFDDGLTTVSAIHKRYASNKNWSKEVVSQMDKMYNYSKLRVLKF